jgi:hypothetical protein
MEMLLIAIAIVVLLALGPLTVKPKEELVSPTPISRSIDAADLNSSARGGGFDPSFYETSSEFYTRGGDERYPFESIEGFDWFPPETYGSETTSFGNDDSEPKISDSGKTFLPDPLVSDLALSNRAPEVFWYEGKRYIATTCNDILIIRQDS